MKIRISALDKQFSDYIRTRDKWVCQRCFKKHDPEDKFSKMGLHNSHFHGRSKKSTRFDPTNCVSLCFGCHQHFHGNPLEHADWFRKRLGSDEFDRLTLRANTPVKFDPFLVKLQIKELMKELA